MKYCPKCGIELLQNEKFCHNCGNALQKVSEESTTEVKKTENTVQNPQGKGMIFWGLVMTVAAGFFCAVLKTEQSGYKYRRSVVANNIWGGSSGYAPNVDSLMIVAAIVLVIGIALLIIGIARYTSTKK